MSNIVATACIVALALIFAVALGAVASRLHPLLDLAGQFLLPATVAAGAIVVIALLIGRPTIAVAAIVGLILNLAIAWPWLQPPPAEKAEGPRFKLLVFNVFVYNPRLDLAEKLVREANADIVVLYEVVPRVRAKLAGLETLYPYRFEGWPVLRSDAWILSRFPLTDVIATLPPTQTRRSLAVVGATIENRPLTLFATHLILPFPFKRMQAQPEQAHDLAVVVAGANGPRLVVGDFNAATWGASVTKQSEKAPLRALTGPEALGLRSCQGTLEFRSITCWRRRNSRCSPASSFRFMARTTGQCSRKSPSTSKRQPGNVCTPIFVIWPSFDSTTHAMLSIPCT